MESTKYYLGLDVGGTNMVAGVVDENHQIIAKESIPTQAGRTIEEITTDMAEVSKKAVLKAGLQMEECPHLRLFKEAYLIAYLYSQRRQLRDLWRGLGRIGQPIYRRHHANARNGSRRRNYHG